VLLYLEHGVDVARGGVAVLQSQFEWRRERREVRTRLKHQRRQTINHSQPFFYTGYVHNISGGFPGLTGNYCGVFSTTFQELVRRVEVLVFTTANATFMAPGASVGLLGYAQSV